MNRQVLMNILKDFISSDIKVDELADRVDDWLFKLRQKPEVTDIQELVSRLELYLHEAKEGYRSWDEIYGYIFSLMERNLSEYYTKTVTMQTSDTPLIDTVTSVKDYHLPLVTV